jgi:hypothetical protein
MTTPIVITALPAGSALGGTEAVPVVQTGVTVQVPASYFIAAAQPANGTLSAIAALATTGLIARTGSGTAATRTVTGAARIIVTNGDGVAGNPTLDLASGIVSASTYKSVTVDTYGRVTAGTNPTTLSGYGITDAQPLNANLTALAALSVGQTSELTALAAASTTGSVHRTATATYVQRTLTGTASQITVTNGDGVAGNPTVALTSGVLGTPGTYKSVTADTYGRITAGTNPTTLAGYGITDAQPLSTELTGLAGLVTTGMISRTGAGSYIPRTLTGTARLTVTNGDGIAGVPTFDLASGVVTPGTYSGVTVDTYGRVTAATTPGTTTGTFSGVTVDSLGRVTAGTTPGTTPGTYTSVTVDSLGRVTAGTTPSAATGYSRTARTSNTLLVATDKGKYYDITSGTFTQTFDTAANLGATWNTIVGNSGTGDITIPLSDGVSNWVMYPGEIRLFSSDGSAINSACLQPGRKVFTASGTAIIPPGWTSERVRARGAGGGAVNGTNGSNGTAGGGGGGGGELREDLLRLAAGTSVSVTIGAGGIGAVAAAAFGTGTAGGDTTFGTYVTAKGGLGCTSGTGAKGGGEATTASNVDAIALQGAGANGCSEFGGAGGSTAGANGGGSSLHGSPGGGAGSSGGVAYPGGTVGVYVYAGGGAAGTTSASPTAGTAGTSRSDGRAGDGGGGGGNNNGGVGNGAAGGNGGDPGGGGGGGGGCSAPVANGGAGGNGGRGELELIGASA